MYYGSRAQVESYGDFHLLSSKANPLLPLRVMAQWYGPPSWYNKGCVTHVALPFTFKRILRQKKKNYGNSNIFHHAKLESSKNPLKETKILQEIRTI
jgi:hypothetical protein